MTKSTIELFRDPKHISGYGYLTQPVTEIDVLNALIDWSREPEHLNRNVYKHVMRWQEENPSKTETYYFDGGKLEDGSQACPARTIPYVENVCYLDIYWQPRS